jgi:hypothetical protein
MTEAVASGMAGDSVPWAIDAQPLMAHLQEFARRIKLSGTSEELESSPWRDLDPRAGRSDVAFDSAVYGTTILAKSEHSDLAMAGPLPKGAMLAAEDGTIRKLSVRWSQFDLTPTLSPVQ